MIAELRHSDLPAGVRPAITPPLLATEQFATMAMTDAGAGNSLFLQANDAFLL